MKIHNSSAVSGRATRKNTRGRTDGVFGKLLESEIDQVQTIHETSPDVVQPSMQQAWQALEESVELLDRAMQCMENGVSPSPQMISDIEQLRSRLHQHLNCGGSNAELRQADTLLAVEAERIRSMHA